MLCTDFEWGFLEPMGTPLHGFPGAFTLPDVRPQASCIYIRQGTRAWDITYTYTYIYIYHFNT